MLSRTSTRPRDGTGQVSPMAKSCSPRPASAVSISRVQFTPSRLSGMVKAMASRPALTISISVEWSPSCGTAFTWARPSIIMPTQFSVWSVQSCPSTSKPSERTQVTSLTSCTGSQVPV